MRVGDLRFERRLRAGIEAIDLAGDLVPIFGMDRGSAWPREDQRGDEDHCDAASPADAARLLHVRSPWPSRDRVAPQPVDGHGAAAGQDCVPDRVSAMSKEAPWQPSGAAAIIVTTSAIDSCAVVELAGATRLRPVTGESTVMLVDGQAAA